ncbi:MAG: long-chain-fatty-acid--CoA ligase [Desulfobacterales bacterium]|nr:long-chain-fatty-acid--CoA ligase [Desulfobacterales bacterium]
MQIPMSPVRILQRAVQLYGDKTAVVDGDIRRTYLEVDKRVNRVAHVMTDLGDPGGRVAVLDYNSHRYLELYFGAAASGRVLLPLNIRLSPDEYAYILENAGAQTLIFHGDFKPMVAEIVGRMSGLKQVIIAEGQADEDWITGTYEALLDVAPESPPEPVPIQESEMLNLYYTSGTTGRPKGVVLTHRNVYANAMTSIVEFGLSDADSWYHIAPLFHLADAFFIWAVTYRGGCHVMQRQFEPVDVLETMAREGITATMMVPTMINFLLDVPDLSSYDLKALKWIMVGGAPMSPANAKRLIEQLGCDYISGYGLTETCPVLAVGNLKSTLADRPEEERLGYITRTGLPVVGVEMRVVDAHGKAVPWDGESMGEIQVRGDNVMEGYWNLPEETRDAFMDGWFRTGDLANVDDQGYVLIVDRAKDIIISGGENIASVEVENVVYTHPDVLECAVFAVPHEKWGEVPKVALVLKAGARMTEADLIDYCRERLPGFKVPKSVDFMAELPKTGSGKILKVELRKNYL